MLIHTAHADALHVEGNKIMYADKPVMLQGVATGDPVLARSNRSMDDYYTISHDWNANAARISVHPGTWRDLGRITAVETLKRHVYAAIDSGLFVIITWHAIGEPDAYYQQAGSGLMSDAYDSDFKLALDFWKQMAWHFGKDGRVMFELWNEPTSGPQGKRQKDWSELKPYWESIVKLVRDNGAKNVLLVSGGAWGYDLRGVRESLIDDANTAYAWHVYAGTDDDDTERWAGALDRLDEVKPVVVTEWGFAPDAKGPYRGTAESFGKPFAEQFLRGRNLHYTAWCWHPLWTPSLVEADWKTPTVFGAFVREVLGQRADVELVRP